MLPLLEWNSSIVTSKYTWDKVYGLVLKGIWRSVNGLWLSCVDGSSDLVVSLFNIAIFGGGCGCRDASGSGFFQGRMFSVQCFDHLFVMGQSR